MAKRRPRLTKAESSAWRERYISTYHPRVGTLPVTDPFTVWPDQIEVGDFVLGYGYVTSVRGSGAYVYISTDLTDCEIPLSGDEVRLEQVGLPPHVAALKEKRGY
jgi:hypothetical protein